MPFLLAEILNFQGSTHLIGVGSLSYKKMEKAANHLLSLINDVLQMSKLEDGREEFSSELVCLSDVFCDI